MKKLEIKYKSTFEPGGAAHGWLDPKEFTGGVIETKRIDVEATLQALCDAVNELSKESCPCGEKEPHTHDTGISMSHQPSKSNEIEVAIEKLAMAVTHSEQGEYAKNETYVRDIINDIVRAKDAETKKAVEDGIGKAYEALADWQCKWRDTPTKEHYGIAEAMRIIKALTPPEVSL